MSEKHFIEQNYFVLKPSSLYFDPKNPFQFYYLAQQNEEIVGLYKCDDETKQIIFVPKQDVFLIG